MIGNKKNNYYGLVVENIIGSDFNISILSLYKIKIII